MLIAPITDIRGDEAILDEDHWRKQPDRPGRGRSGKTPADLIDQAKASPEQAASAFPGHAGCAWTAGEGQVGVEGDWHRE